MRVKKALFFDLKVDKRLMLITHKIDIKDAVENLLMTYKKTSTSDVFDSPCCHTFRKCFEGSHSDTENKGKEA